MFRNFTIKLFVCIQLKNRSHRYSITRHEGEYITRDYSFRNTYNMQCILSKQYTSIVGEQMRMSRVELTLRVQRNNSNTAADWSSAAGPSLKMTADRATSLSWSAWVVRSVPFLMHPLSRTKHSPSLKCITTAHVPVMQAFSTTFSSKDCIRRRAFEGKSLTFPAGRGRWIWFYLQISMSGLWNERAWQMD